MISIKAQPVSMVESKHDTTDSIQKRISQIVSSSFNSDIITIQNQLSVLMAYEHWANDKKEDFFMPISEKVNIYAHKAQSELMLGIYKAYILEYLIPDESGVLPLIDRIVQHADSALVNYGKLNKYVIMHSLEAAKIDSATASVMSQYFKQQLELVEDHGNFDELFEFNTQDMLMAIYEEAKIRYSQKAIHQTLLNWFVNKSENN